MLTNKIYKPINCDDYDNLALACQQQWTLAVALKNGEQLQAIAMEMVTRKNSEYLAINIEGEIRELRLDHITHFSHPELGTVFISESD